MNLNDLLPESAREMFQSIGLSHLPLLAAQRVPLILSKLRAEPPTEAPPQALEGEGDSATAAATRP